MLEISRILCPLDLSDVSKHAVDHAVLLSRWYGAKITALHVVNPIVVPLTGYALVDFAPPPSLPEAEVAACREQVRACVSAATALDVEILVDTGDAAPRIVEHSRSLRADLIVIGTHGVGGFQHLILGSVTERVLRQATCPVLTVPPRARATSRLPFKRILCPTDFSESSAAALDFGLSLAQESDAELTILHVSEWPRDGDPLSNGAFDVSESRLQRELDLRATLDALVPASVRDWCRPSTRLGHGKPYREILGVATEDSADLIVMGVHGRNPLDLMLFGSTTNQVVRRATCPVLTVRR